MAHVNQLLWTVLFRSWSPVHTLKGNFPNKRHFLLPGVCAEFCWWLVGWCLGLSRNSFMILITYFQLLLLLLWWYTSYTHIWIYCKYVSLICHILYFICDLCWYKILFLLGTCQIWNQVSDNSLLIFIYYQNTPNEQISYWIWDEVFAERTLFEIL